MKVDPLNLLFNEGAILDKKFYFISGNEITLMEKIFSFIANKYKKENFQISKIDTIENFINTNGLFEDKKIFVSRGCKGINRENIDKIKKQESSFIFLQENSPKNKMIKNFFNKDENSYLINCYELNKNEKTKVINEFFKNKNIKIPENIFWYLTDKLDNRYSLLEGFLDKITKLGQKEIKIENINKLLTIDDVNKDKIFFSLLKNHKEIVSVYREKVLSTSDVNELYYYCKYYCQLIIDSNNIKEYNDKIPKYLFKEKNFLIDVFKKYNQKKKKMLLNLLYKTEKALRKEGGLSLITGLRFVLSIKRITTS